MSHTLQTGPQDWVDKNGRQSVEYGSQLTDFLKIIKKNYKTIFLIFSQIADLIMFYGS